MARLTPAVSTPTISRSYEPSWLPKAHHAGGRRGKERAASLRAEQRLAAGGRRPPDPEACEADQLYVGFATI
jgi:hypothetical protein